ncbi:MAG: aminotransferase class IV [Acidobacteria bacterium]|nr:aminotransferase class IV [Acidobacteriota bacterium]
MEHLIWDDGNIRPRRPPVADEVAWGAFTTVGCERGRLLLWERHRERLHRTLGRLSPGASFRLPPEPDLVALLEANRLLGSAKIRVAATLHPGGATWSIRAHAGALPFCGPRVPPSRLSVARWPGIPALADLKMLSRGAWDRARRDAMDRGADDAILVTRDGQVLETSVANVFALFGTDLTTPPADGRCLPGTLREWLFGTAGELGLSPSEQPLSLDDLLAADEVWTTNALIGVRPVGAIGSRTFASWPLWQRLVPLGVPAPGWPGH